MNQCTLNLINEEHKDITTIMNDTKELKKLISIIIREVISK